MEKITVTFPDDLLGELNSIAETQKKNRSQVVRDAVAYYIKREKQLEQEIFMVEGYREMSRENERDAQAYLDALNDL
jgi:CopG family transcriptional regulator / antitoxin EndoAI